MILILLWNRICGLITANCGLKVPTLIKLFIWLGGLGIIQFIDICMLWELFRKWNTPLSEDIWWSARFIECWWWRCGWCFFFPTCFFDGSMICALSGFISTVVITSWSCCISLNSSYRCSMFFFNHLCCSRGERVRVGFLSIRLLPLKEAREFCERYAFRRHPCNVSEC